MKSLAEGTILENRYRIRNLLGQGGMSRVYLAEDIRLGVRVAVKENLQTTGESRHQFILEAKILARLSHPNLPRVIDHFVDEESGRQYLVMDYIEGQDLHTMIDRAGFLSEATAVDWIRQLLSALEYLHSQNPPVIHRDIKPSNVKITPEGRVVLVDFGIAKIHDPRHPTITGAQACTPGYAAPEQYGMHTNERSDIYSVGATLYTMLTGRVPPGAPLRMLETDTLIPPSRIVPDISSSVENGVMRALEVSTDRRWESVAQFRQSLEGRRATQKAGTPTRTAFMPRSAGDGRRWRFATIILASVGVGVFILLLVVINGIFQRTPSLFTGMGVAMPSATQTPTATPTATRTTIPPTPTSTRTLPTPTMTQTPQMLSTVPRAAGVLVHTDDFGDPSTRWCEKVSHAAYERYCLNGELHFIEKSGGHSSFSQGRYKDFIMQVQARSETGSGEYGVIFRGTRDGASPPSYYIFKLKPTGRFGLTKWLQDVQQEAVLVEWTESSAINKGQATNLLEVVANRTQISLFVNGVHLITTSDASFSEGLVGMLAGQGAHAVFDNLKVWMLP